MNDLNSVLVEGNLKADPALDDESVCRFSIDSRHRSKHSVFGIEVSGELGAKCAEYLQEGRAVRVLGHLRSETDERVTIVAEHVEFRTTKQRAER